MQDPETIVACQLEAYNQRDIHGFMACWAADARILAWPDTVIAQGAEAIRERHLIRFADPSLDARLLSRVAVEEIVVDRENVTRLFPEGRGTAEVIGIYEVRDGLIRTAWFKQGEVRLHDAG